jgi:hypothetical protein
MTGTTSGGTTGNRAATATPPAPSTGTAPAAGTPRTLSIRLPLVTITFGPQPGAPTPAPVPAPPAASAARGATLERLAFYGGVAAAGVVGALEWPVAVAVAAGTWVAQHTLPAPRRPADPAPSSAARDAGTPTASPAGAAGG